MKFNIFSKKDKQAVQNKSPDEYIENEDEEYADKTPTPTFNIRPITSQSNKFSKNSFITNTFTANSFITRNSKKNREEYDDEDFSDDDEEEDKQYYQGEDDDDDDDEEKDENEEDFDRKYRKDMKKMAKLIKPQKVDDCSKETQKVLQDTFETFYEKESEVMINMIEESREDIKNSVIDLFLEQQNLKDDLMRISNGRYGKQKKENVVSLSMYLRRKRGEAGLINEPYGASNANFDSQQHITDKLAVEKYVKKKERQKVAETNRLNREKTTAEIEAETKTILNKLQAVDLSKEKERERQMEKIKMKLKEKNAPQKNDQQVANEIMETYNDAKTAFERERQLQQERIRQRLNQAKDAEGRPLTGLQRNGNSAALEPRKHDRKVPQIDI